MLDSFVDDGVRSVEAALLCGGFLAESCFSLRFYEVGLEVDPCFVGSGFVVPLLARVEEDSCRVDDSVDGVDGVVVADGASAVRCDFLYFLYPCC